MSNKIVPQTYRSVIDDVINSIRSEFDEYGVSEDVLADLQTRWESKIIASHVAEFEPDPKQAANSNTPPSNPPSSAQPSFPPPPPPPHPSQYPPHPHYPPHPSQQYQNNGPPPPVAVKSEPGLNESRYPLTVGQAMHLQTFVHPHPPHPHQQHPGQPGATESALQFQQQQRRAGGPPPWVAHEYGKGKARQEALARIPQLDGPSSTSSASSSTPPPGAGLAGSVTVPKELAEGGASEEINSDLDDSDSDGEAAEEAETGGPEQDIVFCTYDKVARVKNKWKCVLKDGMVHVNGKDYLFAKCTGEFEW
ncbi:transcription factor IIA, alpha/beta subunit [Gautieria morchelliformis]|nr:transcription factor IIA, alpha/beta subunit [Gautieria morchelliformis]